jgi:hypothetical protein
MSMIGASKGLGCREAIDEVDSHEHLFLIFKMLMTANYSDSDEDEDGSLSANANFPFTIVS